MALRPSFIKGEGPCNSRPPFDTRRSTPDGLTGGASATLTAASRTRSDTFPTGGGKTYAIEDYRHPHTAPVSLDYCCLHATRGTPLVKWEGERYSRLEDLPAEEGFGPQNVRARPYRGVKDGRPTDLAPALIDAGVRLPGINDGFKGKAPDIGPEEAE
ncbi:MAG: hypothetical protein R6X20_05590 [Phycisphaerae bacterium]